MAELILNIMDGLTAQKTAQGLEIDSIIIVRGLTGTGEEKLLNAMDESGIPIIGTGHPNRPTARLKSITPTPIDSDTVKLTLHYSSAVDSSGSRGGIRAAEQSAGISTPLALLAARGLRALLAQARR